MVNMNQALIVLGEYTLRLRLVEDERDSIRAQAEELAEKIAQQDGKIESLEEERTILIRDRHDQDQVIVEMNQQLADKEGGTSAEAED